MEVYSVHFAYSGSNAIKMRDPVTDQFLGATSEWVKGLRNNAIAYVRGSSFSVRVVFKGSGSDDGYYDIEASGSPGGFKKRSVKLTFSSGYSNSVTFDANFSLLNQVGVVDASYNWRAKLDKHDWKNAGQTTHKIYTTWKPMQPDPNNNLYDWVYVQLIQWTSLWAAGHDSEKSICDAILRHLAASGMQYYVPAWTIRDMLLQNGGMCGGWSSMFQYMAYCQGVFVYRRAYLVDWRDVGSSQVQWNAIVVVNGGLNRTSPPVPAMTYNDNNIVFPISSPTVVNPGSSSRYRFWGRPGGHLDGHSINFLTYGGSLYLYDPSFGAGPFKIDMPLPPDNFTILGGTELSSFKANYLNSAVLYMMGSLYNGTVFYESIPPSASSPGQNGMTVKTSLIPDEVAPFDEITFYWGP